MVFSFINSRNEKYYLNSRLGGKNKVKLYYFSKTMNPHTKEDALPEDREIIEHPTTRMPLLRHRSQEFISVEGKNESAKALASLPLPSHITTPASSEAGRSKKKIVPQKGKDGVKV